MLLRSVWESASPLYMKYTIYFDNIGLEIIHLISILHKNKIKNCLL